MLSAKSGPSPSRHTPWELENTIAEWVAHYNHERYHESLDNVTPAVVYNGKINDILDRRSMIKSMALTQRKVQTCDWQARLEKILAEKYFLK